jgi:hypothetical protein
VDLNIRVVVPQPPRLARGPNINGCLVTAPDGSGGHAVLVKVKAYPPQVSSYLVHEVCNVACLRYLHGLGQQK